MRFPDTVFGMASGYSGTRLAKKLGIRDGHCIVVLNEPEGFRALLDPMPGDTSMSTELKPKRDIVIGFFTALSALDEQFDDMADAIHPNNMMWICWPKKEAKVETDLTREVVRDRVLQTKLVDVKICAIDATWSGLKVVWRTEHR